MATGAAAGGDGILRGIFDGCISCHDMGVQRRPYHRNCGCALHKSKGNCCHSSRHNSVSYPIRRSWSESCLALMPSANLSPGSSPSSLAAVPDLRRSSQSVLCNEEED